MALTCVNNGGITSQIRLSSVPRLNEDVHLEPEAMAALAHWQPRVGESITLLDPEETAYCCRIVTVDAESCVCLPLQRLPGPIESLVQIELYLALPEQAYFEPLLRTLTELGVHRIATMQTFHSGSPDDYDPQKSSRRWSDVIIDAAKYCQRAILPELHMDLTFEEALVKATAAELKLLLFANEASWSLVEGFGSLVPQSVALLVGPEDGFAEDEVAMAQDLGFLPVSLGPRRLKRTTAALVATALVQGHLGDLR